MSRVVQVSVIGSARGEGKILKDAEQVGRLLAERGTALVCGGGPGVMEAASRGARSAGGVVLGILRGTDKHEANEFVTHVIATGIGQARNLAVVASGDAVIAVGGEWGTLSEIAFARRLERKVVALDSWSLTHRAGEDHGIVEAGSPREAVDVALTGLVDG